MRTTLAVLQEIDPSRPNPSRPCYKRSAKFPLGLDRFPVEHLPAYGIWVPRSIRFDLCPKLWYSLKLRLSQRTKKVIIATVAVPGGGAASLTVRSLCTYSMLGN